MKRFGMVSMVAALVLSAGFSAVRADSFGTLGFADIGAPTAASFTLAFTQTPANTGGISDSATLAIPAGVVPEPSSITMVGMGLAALGVVGARRKRMLAKA